MTYHRQLSKFTVPQLTRACNAAVKAYPDFFPTLGQLQSLAVTEYVRDQQSPTIAAEEQKLLAASIEAEREKIPWELEKARRYIEAAPNKFECFGRMWEMESKQMRLRPGSDEARAYHLARLRELQRMLEEHVPAHDGQRWCRDHGWQTEHCGCGLPARVDRSSSTQRSSTPSPQSTGFSPGLGQSHGESLAASGSGHD